MKSHGQYEAITAVLFPLFPPENKKCSLRNLLQMQTVFQNDNFSVALGIGRFTLP